jgi:hypothetical protein
MCNRAICTICNLYILVLGKEKELGFMVGCLWPAAPLDARGREDPANGDGARNHHGFGLINSRVDKKSHYEANMGKTGY